MTDVAPTTPVDSNAAPTPSPKAPPTARRSASPRPRPMSTDRPSPIRLTGDTSGGGFTINAATGVVTVADSTKIDYETAPGHAYTVTAQASDGTLTSSQTFTIGVTNAAPSVPVDSDAAANTVVEGAANGSDGRRHRAFDRPQRPARHLFADRRHLRRRLHHQCHDRRRHRRRSHQDRLRKLRRPRLYRHRAGQRRHADKFAGLHHRRVTDVAPSTPVDSNAAANTVVEGAANGRPSASPRRPPTSTARP